MTDRQVVSNPWIGFDAYYGAKISEQIFITSKFDSSREPHYSISELAKFFFNRSPGWVRWRERKGHFIYNAEYDHEKKMYLPGPDSIEFGLERTSEGARYYTLKDVEGIAHALMQKEDITGTQWYLALGAVFVQARIFGYI